MLLDGIKMFLFWLAPWHALIRNEKRHHGASHSLHFWIILTFVQFEVDVFFVFRRMTVTRTNRFKEEHGGFGCTRRYVPLRWLAIGFRAFDKIFYSRNSIRYYRDPTEIARTFIETNKIC